ncbi:4Fe-4S single cluster domain-containing protein [Nonomuraea sp. NPDC050786]|uniref:4Fe-4S single cluster domain-containing protein n=1 Tax=Nonomuraea sp. NPDC050786 TaxID=3154840 RepID=UPI003406F2C2
MKEEILMVADTHPACHVLGPGVRFCVWVQGCPLRCKGCVSQEWIPMAGGRPTPVGELAARVAEQARDGLTLSGGEPFAQAGPLSALVTAVRRARPGLSVMAYTGWTVEWLRAAGTDDQRRLLGLLDLLVDGPYVAARHADLRWRGSANQRIHLLSDRHRGELGDDHGQGLQFEVTTTGSVHWMGVPPVPGFRPAFEQALHLRLGESGEQVP